MSIRDEVWQAFLGRALSQEEIQVQALLCDTLQLQDNDPFWGVVTFFYYQTTQLRIQQQNIHKELTDELHLLQENTQPTNTACSDNPLVIEDQPVDNTHNKKFILIFKLEHYLLIALLVMTLMSLVFTIKRPPVISYIPSIHDELINWGNMNPQAKEALLTCKFSSQSRIVEQHHQRICYPAGEGVGYYLNSVMH
jgi:hypothetical protein